MVVVGENAITRRRRVAVLVQLQGRPARNADTGSNHVSGRVAGMDKSCLLKTSFGLFCWSRVKDRVIQ